MDADSHPDFAVVWSFFNKFSKPLEIEEILITDVIKWISSQANQSSPLVDVMVRLMRKTGMRVDKQRWQKHLVKAAAKVDLALAEEMQAAGFHSLSVPKKLRLIKFLCEMQFDDNLKFKSVINNEEAEVQRLKPVGRDEDGLVYWHQEDEDLNIRVYVEDEDDDEDSGWKVVCRSKEDVDDLIKKLANEPAGKSKDENSDEEDDDIVETKFQIFLKNQCTSESHDDRGEDVAQKSKDETMTELQNDVFVKKENTDSMEGFINMDSQDLEGSQLKREDAVKNNDAVDASEIKSKTAVCKIISDRDQNSSPTAIKIEPPSESTIEQPVKPLQNVEIKMEAERSADVSSREIKLTEKSSVKTESGMMNDSVSHCEMAAKVISDISENPKAVSPNVSEIGESSSVQTEKTNKVHDENSRATDDKVDDGISESSKFSEPDHGKSGDSKALESVSEPARVVASVPVKEELENLETIDDNKNTSDDNIKDPVLEQDIKATVVCPDLNRQQKPEVEKTKHVAGMILHKSTTPDQISAEVKVELLDSSDRSPVSSDVTLNKADNPDSTNLGEKLPEKSVSNAEVTKDPPTEKAQERLLEFDSVPAELSESDPEPRKTLGSALTPVETPESYAKTAELSGSAPKPTELLGSDPKAEEMLGCGPKLELLDSGPKATELSWSDPRSMELSALKPAEISGHDLNHAEMPGSAQNTVELVTETAEQKETLLQPSSTGNEEVCVSEAAKTEEATIRNGGESKKDNNEEGEDKEGKKNVKSGEEGEEMKTKKPTPRKKGKRKRGRATSKRRRAQTTIKKPLDRPPKEKKPKFSRLALLTAEAESILHLGEKKSNGEEDTYRTRSGRRVKSAKKNEPEVWQTVGEFGAIDNTKKDSDADEDFEFVEKKRGRTNAPVKDSPVKEIKRIVNNDTPCMKCGLFSHPETILLCDCCDKGHHMACLTPPLMIVPDEEWFCPKCSKEKLIARLKKIYDEFDSKQKLHQRKSRQTEYKKLMNDYTGISATNIISNPSKPEKPRSAPKKRRRSYSSNSDSDDLIDDKSDSSSPSSPELKLTRTCRAKQVSYDFSTFDKTIMDAIGEDIHAKPEEPDEGPISGKDIRTIIAAEKGEDAKDLVDEKDDVIPGKRRKRNLTNLNSSEDEAVESGSNYSFSESEEEIEEEFRASNNTDSEGSLTGGRRRKSARGRKKPYIKPTKRSKRLKRKRIEEDYETSLSECSTDYEEAPKQKKAKKSRKWNDYGRESSEEEYVPPRAVRDSKFIDDDDEQDSEKKTEKPKRQRVVKSSSDEGDNEQKDKNDNTEQKESDKKDPENDNEKKDKTQQKESDKKDGDDSSDDWSSLSSNAAGSSEEASVSESENTKPEGTTTQT